MKLACQQLCKRNLRRIHLTCLTCLVRRYHYSKVNTHDYVCVGKGGLVRLENFVLPEQGVRGYTPYTYYFIINYTGNRFKQFLKRYVLLLLHSLYKVFYGLPVMQKHGSFTVKTFQYTVFPVNAIWVAFTVKSGRGIAYTMSGWDCAKANVFKTFCSFAELIANW